MFEVPAEDFEVIHGQVRDVIRTVIVPRESEIAETDEIPEDLRAAATATAAPLRGHE